MFWKNFLLVFVVLLVQSASAQRLYDEKLYGPYTLLFELSDQQADFAVHNQHKLDTAMLYTKLVGKVHTDSAIPLHKPQVSDWPVKPHSDIATYNKRYAITGRWNIHKTGYYIEVNVSGINQVQYRIIEVPAFYTSVARINFETFVFVEDSAGLPVIDARVHLDTYQCRYDKSIGGYKINRKNISGTLSIKKGSEFVYKIVYGYSSSSNNGAPPRDNYNYAKISYQGYMVTNKPKYKPGDTLFFKAFVVNKRAKALKKKLVARLYQNESNVSSEMELTPNPRGAYSGYFVIGDSFLTDKSLGINLLDESRNVVKYADVYLENYDLKELVVSVITDRKTATPGSGLKVMVSSTNKAGLPIMEGSVNIRIAFESVQYPGVDSVVIPYKKWSDFYNATVQADPSGVTIFEIPDSIFLPLTANYYIYATLQTADNDVKTESTYFSYETVRDRLEAEVSKDTLRVNRLYNMQSVRRKMRAQFFSYNARLYDSAFYTPFQAYLPPNVLYVQLFQGDTMVGTYYRQIPLPEIKGKRSHDSVHIEFHSTKDIPVFFRIYKNNELVHSGQDTALQYRVADKSKHSYHLQYGVISSDIRNRTFYGKSFHLKEKELHVQIKQPGTIYPGQEVAVEIYVKNAFGKPARKVNLTAYAVNTQLEDIRRPEVPYLGLEKPEKSMPIYHFPIYNCTHQFNGVVKPWHLQKLYLYENSIFHMAYPKKGFEVLHDTTPQKTTEIAFYNHSLGNYSPVLYVLKNDSLFHSEFVAPYPKVQRIQPGNYDFTFRVYDRIYTAKNVSVKAGFKNFVCLNADSLQMLKLGDTIAAGRYTNEEYNMLQRHFLFFKYDYWLYDTLSVRVNGKTVLGLPAYSQQMVKNIYTTKAYFNKNTQKTEYYKAENFQVLGPFFEGATIEFAWKNSYAHQFTFSPSQTVSFTKNDVVGNTKDPMQSGFQYFSKFAPAYYYLRSLWWDPDAPIVPEKPGPVTPQNYEYVQTLPQFEYQHYNPPKWEKHSQLHLYIPQYYQAKRIWIFSREDSSQSMLVNYPGVEDHSALGLVSYRYLSVYPQKKLRSKFLLVIQNNDSSWVVKPMEIDSSAYVYLVLKPTDFRKLRQSEFMTFDRMAKILGRRPFAKFEDTPTIHKDLNLIRLPNKNGITALEGTVNGPNLNYVVENAFVILEREGRFARGAMTNSDGRFLMDSIESGTYMLKIKGSNYHYWISYQLVIEKGKYHILYVKMQPYARFTYKTPMLDADGNEMADAISLTSNAYAPMEYNAAGAPSYYYNADMISTQEVKKMSATASVMSRVKSNGRKFKDRDADGVPDKAESYEWDFGDGNDKEGYEGFVGKYGLYSINSEPRLDEMAQNPAALRIRKSFRDYAYWIPNLTTNKSGYATYSVLYPDNITSWQTYVPAMDGKRHSGLGEMVVKSYKPVSSNLALPHFLTEGDALYSYGRIMNYTGKPISGIYTLLIDSTGKSRDIEISNYFSDSMHIRATMPGKVFSIQSGFEMANGYRDIELRKLPVIPASVTAGKSAFFQVKNDTTLEFKNNGENESLTVVVYNQELAMVKELLQQVSSSIYPDNLSAADKLNALLIAKYISEKLNIPFDQEKEIHEALKKLRNAQSSNGSFGWYRNSNSVYYLTGYAAEVMYKAENMGYSNNGWLNAARYLERQLPSLYEEDALIALYTLKKLNRELAYKDLLVRIHPKEMGLENKLKYQILLQMLQNKGNKQDVVENLHPTEHGELYVAQNPGIMKYSVFADHAATTFLAWDLLSRMNADADTRKLLIAYLANRTYQQTHGKILAAECMVKEYENTGKLDSTLKPVVYANGQLVPSYSLPAIMEVASGKTLQIKHSGAPVFIATSRSYKTYNPVSDATSFGIKTSIEGRTDSVALSGGKAAVMKVTVFAKSQQENVVIEVPIPAGCVYNQKIQSESIWEKHREYAYDRVYIYLDQMPFGYHEFSIALMPRFSGTFHTAPARAALMFYGDKAAYTSKKQFSIH